MSRGCIHWKLQIGVKKAPAIHSRHAFESIVPDSTETRQYLQQLDAAIQCMLAGKNTPHP